MTTIPPAVSANTPAINGHGGVGIAPSGTGLNGNTRKINSTSRATVNGASGNGYSSKDSAVNGTGSSAAIPIAVCGMALRLPGGLTTPQQLWEFLLAKGDARTRVPETRYNVSAFHSMTGKPGSVATEHGYFLDESVDLGALDTSFFSMPRSEVERADPQQRLMLEVARECFEDAGVTNWRGTRTGCYVGSFGEDWVDMFAKETQPWGLHRVVGTGDWALSNRLSYEMDLQGPSQTVRTACSSALTCLNEACMAISRGDCGAALVGGVNLIMSPTMTMAMTEQGVLSKDGSCKSFSADANGYARGEAVTAIYVKPLSAAIRDGNPVRAVIRATSHNVDGKTPGMSQPSTDAQESLIRRAYEIAGITDYGATAMVECHGTGTPTGDPIEAKAVARVFGEWGVHIGSIKPNLGHAEGASGLVSVIKMVLALENRVIPPNIRFTAPNPNIPFESAKLIVPLEPTPWPHSRLERVSVNSFGIGGANAHVILESATSFSASAVLQEPPTAPQLLLYSANATKSLTRMTQIYEQWVGKNPEKVCDLAYTLAMRREHRPYRTFAIVNNGTIGSTSPPVKDSQKLNIIMVFTGQGAQWPLMGRELLQSNATFRASIRDLDQHLRGMTNNTPAYSIEEELVKPAKKSRMNTATLSQPLCTAIQIALVDALRSISVSPDAVVGHSSGEIGAAYASGALTAREAIIAAHHRGAVTTKQKRAGSMAAIGMSWQETEEHLISGVSIACDNSPKSVTISGDTDAVRKVVANIKQACPDTLAKLLQVDKAYHSNHMVEIGDDYLSLIGSELSGKKPAVLFFSSVTGKPLGENQTLGSKYWQENLESPVRFRQAVTSILEHEVGKNAIFLEIGPHSALAGPLRQIFTQTKSSASYIATMTRNQNCIGSFLTTVGKLYSLRVPVDLRPLFPRGSCLVDLPRYPWNHEGSYWHESRLSKEWRHRKHPYHDLLGARVPESTDLEPVWRNLFHLQNVPWVRDHKVGEDIVFPFAGYIALTGEGVKQISGIEDGFSIRKIIVSMALVLAEGKPTEIMTTFRPQRLTNSLNSQWWEFTVASYNGHLWNKHCTGEIMAIPGNQAKPFPEPEVLPRKLVARKWYEGMAKNGLDLGPRFQTLQTLETSTDATNTAVGQVTNGACGDEANYHIHPTVIDATLQLHSAAAVNGYARKVRNWLPTSIAQLSITRCSSDMISSVTARVTSNSSIVGQGRCTCGGNMVLEASGVRMSPAEGSMPTDTLRDHAAARLTWGSDIDFMDIKTLIQPTVVHAPHLSLLDELTDLCLASTHRFNAGRETSVDHMRKHMSWVNVQVQSPQIDQGLNPEAISAHIDDLVQQLSETPVAPAARAVQSACENMGLLSSGEPLENVFSEEMIKDLHRFVYQIDRSEFVRCLGHSRPNLRVLEIGTEMVPLVSDVLKDLALPGGQIRCSKYTFTSKGFISGKDQHKAFPNMEYATLDTRKDLGEQGFEDRQYDLVIATDLFYEADRLRESLVNIRKLLAPDGHLLLQEICPSSKWINYVFGAQPKWWSHFGQGEPRVNAEKWDSELSAAGFGSIKNSVVLDSQEPHQSTAVIVARPILTKKAAQRVTLLCGNQGDKIESVVTQLVEAGYEITKCNIEDSPPPGQDVVSLLDGDGPFFEAVDSARYQCLKRFLHGLNGSGMLWVTPASQIGCKDPRFAQVIGFARAMRSEMLIDLATCEIESFHSPGKVVDIFAKFQMRGNNDPLKPDFEYAIVDGEVKVGRFYPFTLRDELLVSESDDRAVLDVGTPGRINSLHWSCRPREKLQCDEVEVEVYSAGLNFRDILVALGIVELPVRQFGLEAAGVVTRAGPEVTDLKVGDRVLCLKKQAFASYINLPQFSCARIPDNLNFDEAATMLVPACGGVGLAAVQVAQMMGADIFATVGSDEKVDYLMNTFNLPRQKILHSRDSSFVNKILRETDGKGVDIALNSLSGELLHATWSCVAEFGKMVEIGKRDLLGGGKLDMHAFLANRSYSCVDIDQLWKRPNVLKKLIDSTLKYYQQGSITPVRPVKAFTAAKTQDAFRYMQKGQHIGRIGLSIRQTTNNAKIDFETTKRPRPIQLGASASYLLVGGLGGLGRAISAWMVDHGASELIFLSRSAGTGTKDEAFVGELNSMGCDVKLIRGDVTVSEDVTRAVAAATLPLKGVIQMSMVLRDQNFESMTLDEWNAAIAPKVQGTWNLHNATTNAGADLDFFILFSSLSGLVGQPGQANYASGNTFLDAFTQYRSSQGLPASTVDIGAVEDIGFISQSQELMNKMKGTGFKGIAEQELLDAMALAMTTRPGRKDACGDSLFADANTFVLGLGSTVPLSSPDNRAIWRRDRRMAVYHNAASGTAGATASNEALKAFLISAKADPSVLKTAEAANLLAVEIGKKLFDLLLKQHEELNTSWPLVDLGLDSAKFNTSRHSLGLCRSVILTGHYVVAQPTFESDSIKSLVENALATVVLRHAMLRVGIADEHTANPTFVNQDAIDFRHVIEWKETTLQNGQGYTNSLLRSIESQHDKVWEHLATGPAWKIIVHQGSSAERSNSVQLDIAFAFHHAIGDGQSALVFHRDLLRAFNSGCSPVPGLKDHVLRFNSQTILPPPMEVIVPFTISWSLFLMIIGSQIWKKLAPSWIIRELAAQTVQWTGKPVTIEPFKTNIRLFHIPASTTTSLVTACRLNGTTLTPLVHALALASMSSRIRTAPTFRLSTPVSLRPFTSPVFDRENMMHCLVTARSYTFEPQLVSRLREAIPHNTSLAHEFAEPLLWRAAVSLGTDLKNKVASLPRDDQMGLASWVADWDKFWLDRVGKKREESWACSNAGSLKASNSKTLAGDANWHIERIIFTQGALPMGPAFNINVAGIEGQGLWVTITWQETIVETLLVEGVVADLQALITGFVGCHRNAVMASVEVGMCNIPRRLRGTGCTRRP
ncbi:hypothetical protein DL764_010773 [Monosporascus ibericus]|uniref:Carrier domain-containing protein n=1 Tax=Monosporascus ibericus TaxID=155417 RepID=A0A4Q4STH5_9PEZI|nr:hypothetical protein DL764_010773 [Monosporascus ibericus]